ncbi:mandelate racemase/muconate lactonizing enzyme family protein [Microlunatus flavus]|uniref:Galactonate dehydratase n=1 Tax=Microlunatus flavus TaxID=1036181 RepID=A0A1H9DV77_9ACTN|nr:mandelate racemase/muconate lactonizing enzyme family protein [Microlunatus flavus]SEQ16753.1 galactonate dehydratase [Microlunatus flavus]
MRITRLVPWLVRSSASFWGQFLFVEVRTDEGVTGWGEITSTTRTANRSVARMLREVEGLVAGEDPAAIELVWHKLFRAFTYAGSRGAACTVASAVDIALWDIRGKVLGVPVADLLGGPVRRELSLYTHPDQSRFATAEGVEEEIGRIVGAGYGAIKFDPFPHAEDVPEANDRYLDGRLSRSDEHRAIELSQQIRAAAGPDVELLVDAHGRFDVPTAIRLANHLHEAVDLHWFEEPVPPESYHALRQVRERTQVPISVGERLHTRWDFVPVLERELADFVMPDVTWTGGISELKKIASMAEAHYVPVSPHDAAGPVNLVAGAHVMATTPNFYRLESSSYDLATYNELLEVPLAAVDGRLPLPTGPGLGLAFDTDYLSANVVDGFGGTD